MYEIFLGFRTQASTICHNNNVFQYIFMFDDPSVLHLTFPPWHVVPRLYHTRAYTVIVIVRMRVLWYKGGNLPSPHRVTYTAAH